MAERNYTLWLKHKNCDKNLLTSEKQWPAFLIGQSKTHFSPPN